MVDGQSGKGSRQRPKFISEEEWELRYDLATGNITKEEYDKKIKEIKNDR